MVGEVGAQDPLADHGKGAFYGLAGTLVAAVIWAAYILLNDGYNVLMPVGAGWFASACVKRGMGTVDRTGIWMSIYLTLLIVFLGELFFYMWLVFSATGQLSVGRPLRDLVGLFRGDAKDLFFMALFTGLGCFVAVINCRESIKKVGKGDAPPEDGR
jgi:hypothetical protein